MSDEWDVTYVFEIEDDEVVAARTAEAYARLTPAHREAHEALNGFDLWSQTMTLRDAEKIETEMDRLVSLGCPEAAQKWEHWHSYCRERIEDEDTIEFDLSRPNALQWLEHAETAASKALQAWGKIRVGKEPFVHPSATIELGGRERLRKVIAELPSEATDAQHLYRSWLNS